MATDRKFKAVFLTAAALFLSAAGWCESASLYPKYSGKADVKVFIGELKDNTGKNEADLAALKTALESAFTERKSIRFRLVPSKAEADIEVRAAVTEFYFTEQDPVDMIAGIGMAAMDAVKQEHYARIQADVSVLDAKNDRALWKSSLKATMTGMFSAAEARKDIGARLARVFMRDAFSKKRSDPHA